MYLLDLDMHMIANSYESPIASPCKNMSNPENHIYSNRMRNELKLNRISRKPANHKPKSYCSNPQYSCIYTYAYLVLHTEIKKTSQ